MSDPSDLRSKTCTKCGAVKATDDFHKDKTGKNGLSARCKACANAHAINYRNKHIERIRAYDRNRGARLTREWSNAYNKAHPEKYRARKMVERALKRGEMVRRPCERCGQEHQIYGHHEDYSKPLDVVWLCSVHHAERHKELRAQNDSH